MGKILDLINTGKTLVSDGAWGTFLHAKGLKAGECPELWNIIHRTEVLDIAKSYLIAGSDLIETNTFGANRFKLEHYGLAQQAFELNKAGAEISREAAGKQYLVLGSIGPTGKLLMMGDVLPDEMEEAFKEQAIALEAGGVDAILIETMTDLQEAVLAIKAAKENTSCEILCTMTFEKSPNNEFHTIMGISPREMAQQVIDAGTDVIGANCGNGIKDMIGIVRELRKANSTIPILVHANAGMPIYQDGKTVFPETPQEMAANVEAIMAAGANIIGGCCGTTPEHIRRIAEIVKRRGL